MKKLFVGIFLTLLLFWGVVNPVLGAETDPSGIFGSSPQKQLNAGDKPSLESVNNFNYQAFFSNSILSSTGPGGTNGGAAGAMTNIVLAMAQRPGGASSVEYLADMGHSLGIVPKEAYAQGAAFTGLSPLLDIWKTMRDFAYIVYILVFFVVGFMILLRKKIDPRTVITVEAALPKLIISLIMITFSYAIVAFMVDIANVVCRVIGSFFIGGPGGTGKYLLSSKGFNEIFNYNFFALVRPIGDTSQIAAAAGKVFEEQVGHTGVPSWLASLSTWAIFSFAMLFITFKIFFALLGPYVGIVLSIIFAPFQILMTAIPGNEASLGNWFKNVLSKVAVFPVVFFLMLLAATFGARTPGGIICPLAGCIDWQAQNSAFQTSMKNLNLVLLPFGNWSAIIGQLIAFGILFTIPATAQLVQNALKVKDQGGDIATQTIMRGMSKVPGLKSLAEK